jgi:hypothetical protein
MYLILRKICFIFVIIFITFIVNAKSIVLPIENGEFKKADLPGYNIAIQKCLICHSQNYIKYQPISLTRKDWENEVIKMQVYFKAPITKEEIPLLAEYLVKIYGSEKIEYQKK